jgi:hypothetical protein
MNSKLYTKIYSIILLLIIGIRVNAQISNYTFTQGTFSLTYSGTNNSITLPWVTMGIEIAQLGYPSNSTPTNNNPLKVIYAGNSTAGSTADYDTGVGYPIGFNFIYHGESFDRVAVSGNGYIKLGHSNQSITLKNDSIAGSIFDGDSYHQNIISAFQTNASIFNTDIPNQSSAIIDIGNAGLPGNRIFVAEYDYGVSINGGADLVILPFQIQLFENGDSIRIAYKTFYDFGTLNTEGAVGITDEQGNYSSREVINGTNTWPTSVAGTSTSNLCDFTASFGPQGSNTQNLVYRWAAPLPAPLAPTCPEAYVFVDQYYPGAIGYGGNGDFYAPLNNATNVPTNPVINWSDVSLISHQVTTYDVYLDISNPPLISVAPNLATNSYTPSTLAPNTTYYYNIVPKNALGKDSACIESFTTDSMPQYCEANPQGDAYINSFILNTLSFVLNSANQLTYEFPVTVPYTTTLKRDTTYICSVTLTGSNPSNPWSNVNVKVWIDFNQDGNFDDPGDEIIGGSGGPNGSFNFNVPILNTAKLGLTGMRVTSKNVADIEALVACNSNYFMGGSQDFIINIAPSTSCENFTINPVITNVNCFGQSNGSINLNTLDGAIPYTVNWTNGSSADEITNLAKGIYQATITDANSCEIATPLIPVLQPMALSVDTATGSNNITMILASGGTAPYTYLWSNGDTSSNSSNLAAGTYSITVTDAHGCDTTMQNIVIKQTNTDTIPPPVDSIKDSSVNIIVYPNPTSGIVYMQSQMQQTAYIQVVSEQGKIMEEGNYTINTSATSIDIAQFSAGIYFLKIVGDKSTRVVKIIKRDN